MTALRTGARDRAVFEAERVRLEWLEQITWRGVWTLEASGGSLLKEDPSLHAEPTRKWSDRVLQAERIPLAASVCPPPIAPAFWYRIMHLQCHIALLIESICPSQMLEVGTHVLDVRLLDWLGGWQVPLSVADRVEGLPTRRRPCSMPESLVAGGAAGGPAGRQSGSRCNPLLSRISASGVAYGGKWVLALFPLAVSGRGCHDTEPANSSLMMSR